MIAYNPKDWFTFIFRFHKADTFRKLLPLIIGICLYSFLIAFLEMEYFKLAETSHVKNIPIMHGMLGFVISLLLVFRTNTAYDRWWEGRKLWGALVNNSRNLAIKIAAILSVSDNEHRAFFRNAIPAFAFALQKHLRSELPNHETEDGLNSIFQHVSKDRHVPNQIAALMTKRVHELVAQGKITKEEWIILNNELVAFTDICGACERIKNTPIPFSYSIFLKKFIFFYVMTLPFGYVFSLGYYVIPVVAFIFYVLASLELVAEEIEEPFGGDENDLPTEQISQNIQIHVGEILG
jgi:ion channel-forming bestrophin family protein